MRQMLWIIAAVASVTGVAHAQQSPQATVTLKVPLTKVQTLAPRLKLTLVNNALKTAGVTPVSSVPAPNYDLSMGQLVHNGAALLQTSTGRVSAADAVAEGGSAKPPVFVFLGDPMRLELTYPAEVGRRYVVDCEVTEVGKMRLDSVGPGSVTTVATVGAQSDHMIGVVTARGAREYVHIYFLERSRTGSQLFRGCEITKL